MNKRYEPNYWGTLDQFEVPYAIVQNERLQLNANALSVLLVFFQVGKAQQRSAASVPKSPVDVKIKQDLIAKRSGFSEDTIRKAVRELTQKNFIRVQDTRKKHIEFGSNIYTLLNPESGAPLTVTGGRNVLWANKVRYIPVPTCIVKEHEEQWSLANMTSSECRVYISLCWLANNE
jgi:hypothetical protein